MILYSEFVRPYGVAFPSKALTKLACGSATDVLPERTTHPVMLMKRRVKTLTTLIQIDIRKDHLVLIATTCVNQVSVW